MDVFREKLISSEKRGSKLYFEATGIRPDSKRNGFYKYLTHDGDLAEYILKGQSTKNSINRNKFYKSCGIPDGKYLLSKFKANLKLNDFSSISKLKTGDGLTVFQISALAKNFSVQPGMYLCKTWDGNDFIILKSSTNNTPYNDHWIGYDNSKFYYYMQKENEKNIKDFDFAKKANRAIFSDLISPLSSRLPIFLFTNEGKNYIYTFQGTFYVLEISKGARAFILQRDDYYEPEVYSNCRESLLSIMSKEASKQLSSYEYVLKKVDVSSYKPKQIKKIKIEGFEPRKKTLKDYIDDYLVDKCNGQRGEELTLEYERNKVRAFAPQCVGKIALAADNLGYDLRSFRKFGSGIRDIHIEVKITPNPEPLTPFFMSSNEFYKMHNDSDKYCLYRIFDLLSSSPKFFPISEGFDNLMTFDPFNYRVIFREAPKK